MENKIKQLRKGILELAIMECLHYESHYGYSLIKTISGKSQIGITEGTIYPILSRLSKESLVKSEWVESKQGPPRKYYSLTEKGKKVYQVLKTEFTKLKEMIANSSKKQDIPIQSIKGKKIRVKKEEEDAK